LPLAARAVHDPFTKAWISAEYHKLGSYENFRTQITQLLWNDQKQSNVRCKIFQDKYDKNGEESLAAHYLRYVNLAANLYPPLSKFDLLGALTAHYPYEVQKCMISANLRSNQEALTLLGRLQAIDGERDPQKGDRSETRQADVRRRDYRPVGDNRGENRREHTHNVRRITYDRHTGNHQRSSYDRHTAHRGMRQNNNARAEVTSQDVRQLNPHVPDFDPTARINRGDSTSDSRPGARDEQ
jgi:hypothetical protein